LGERLERETRQRDLRERLKMREGDSRGTLERHERETWERDSRERLDKET